MKELTTEQHNILANLKAHPEAAASTSDFVTIRDHQGGPALGTVPGRDVLELAKRCPGPTQVVVERAEIEAWRAVHAAAIGANIEGTGYTFTLRFKSEDQRRSFTNRLSEASSRTQRPGTALPQVTSTSPDLSILTAAKRLHVAMDGYGPDVLRDGHHYDYAVFIGASSGSAAQGLKEAIEAFSDACGAWEGGAEVMMAEVKPDGKTPSEDEIIEYHAMMRAHDHVLDITTKNKKLIIKFDGRAWPVAFAEALSEAWLARAERRSGLPEEIAAYPPETERPKAIEQRALDFVEQMHAGCATPTTTEILRDAGRLK